MRSLTGRRSTANKGCAGAHELGGVSSDDRRAYDSETAEREPLIPLIPLHKSETRADIIGDSEGSPARERGESGEDAPSERRLKLQTKTKEEMYLDVFKRYHDEGQIHKDDVERALEKLPHIPKVRKDWVQEIYASMTMYNQLTDQEFISFVDKYMHRQHQEMEEAFRSFDDDDSGFVDVGELAGLLRSFGVEPMEHVLRESISEVDADGQGSLDLAEFEELMDKLVRRECFSASEYEEFCCIFSRFDRDRSGEVDTRELFNILNWLGYAMGMGEVEAIVAEVDIDGTGTISAGEYLMCMRKVRDREVKTAKQAIADHDEDGSGTVSTTELKNILEALGYRCHPTAVRDAAVAAGLDPNDDDLDLSEFWRLLSVYRQREGLTTANIEELEAAFTRYDKDGCGEISTLEVGKVLRWLGYPLGFERQMTLISRVDIDGSGHLDLVELRKMFRMMSEASFQLMAKAFGQHKSDEDKFKDTIAIEDLRVVLSKLEFPGGHTIKPVVETSDITYVLIGNVARGVAPDPPCERVGFDGLLRIAERMEKAGRTAFRNSGGFSESEIQEMHTQFNYFDADGSGDISNKELVNVLESLFPQLAHDPLSRTTLKELLSEVDADGNGSLDFPDFVRLMRQFKDVEDRERAAKEQLAMDQTGFSLQEVSEFRDLFLSSCKLYPGVLTMEEFKAMIQTICPMGDKYSKELEAHFQDITRTHGGNTQELNGNTQELNVRERADFPEFLWLMKKLLDVNFAKILERTQAVVTS